MSESRTTQLRVMPVMSVKRCQSRQSHMQEGRPSLNQQIGLSPGLDTHPRPTTSYRRRHPFKTEPGDVTSCYNKENRPTSPPLLVVGTKHPQRLSFYPLRQEKDRNVQERRKKQDEQELSGWDTPRSAGVVRLLSSRATSAPQRSWVLNKDRRTCTQKEPVQEQRTNDCDVTLNFNRYGFMLFKTSRVLFYMCSMKGNIAVYSNNLLAYISKTTL